MSIPNFRRNLWLRHTKLRDQQLMKISKVVSKATITWQGIKTEDTPTAMTTDMQRSRGSTSAGDGRNVCKGNFSL